MFLFPLYIPFSMDKVCKLSVVAAEECMVICGSSDVRRDDLHFMSVAQGM